MTPRLKIASSVLERLQEVNSKCTGCLFGVMYDNTLLVLGFNVELKVVDKKGTDALSHRKKCYSNIMHSFPTEVDLCGLVTFEDGNDNELHASALAVLQDVDITDNPLLISYQIKSSNSVKAFFYIHEKLTEATYDVLDDKDIWKEFIIIRLKSSLPIICELHSDGVSDSFRSLRKKVAAGMVSFQFLKTDIFLLGGDSESGLSGLAGEPTVHELRNNVMGLNIMSEGSNTSKSKKQAQQSNVRDIPVLKVSMLMKPMVEQQTESHQSAPYAPVIQYTKRIFCCIKMNVPIDTLSLIPCQSKVAKLYAVLVDSVCRSLKLAEKAVIMQLSQMQNNSSETKISIPVPWHFLPPSCGHFITLTYPRGMGEEQLRNTRELIQRELCLPMDRPIFRRANAFRFKEDISTNAPLINPHEGLTTSGVKGGEVSVVQGLYSYHHYMQDRFNDDGWGCAYRSLQTIISWFRWQGYTDIPNPSHQEIQKCLVKLGDKPSSFIGSTQWIGSTEVGFCLESMLGVTSRIIAVNSGEELSNYGGELSHHFKVNGTPIMIGGGVLAHTIIGVDFSRMSGELKFLVLDPHYTGSEDLHIILSKGWCGWKDINFWSKKSYYNLCLPMRPVVI